MAEPKKIPARRVLLILIPTLTLGATLLWFLTSLTGGVAPYRFPVTQEEGRFDSTLEFYRARILASPNSALDHAALASAYLQLGQVRGDGRMMARAEVSARESLRLLPVYNSAAEMVLADLAQARHRFPEAIDRATGILRQDPDHLAALAALIKSYLALGQIGIAQGHADRLVSLSPRSGAFVLRALVQEQSGNAEKALADFRRAYAAEDLGDPEAAAWLRALWGRFHLRRGELGPARSLLREALRLRPDSGLALGMMGDLEAGKENWSAAESYYSNAYRVSGLPLYLLAQAGTRREQGDLAGAEDFWSAAEMVLRESLNEGELGHRRELAALLLARGRAAEIPEALSLLREELRLRRDAETLALLLDAFWRVGGARLVTWSFAHLYLLPFS